MNDFDSIIKCMTVTQPEPGDYTGEDGLLYCGKCRTPKQFRMDTPLLEGRLLPCPCRCKQEQLDREAAEQEAHRHHQTVADMKRRGFTDPAMQELCGALGDHAGREHWLSPLGRCRHREKPFCRVHCQWMILSTLTT